MERKKREKREGKSSEREMKFDVQLFSKRFCPRPNSRAFGSEPITSHLLPPIFSSTASSFFFSVREFSLFVCTSEYILVVTAKKRRRREIEPEKQLCAGVLPGDGDVRSLCPGHRLVCCSAHFYDDHSLSLSVSLYSRQSSQPHLVSPCLGFAKAPRCATIRIPLPPTAAAAPFGGALRED
jgi:hypothetical protein